VSSNAARQAIWEAITDGPSKLPKVTHMKGTPFSLSASLEQSSGASAGRHNIGCEDIDERTGELAKHYRAILQEALGSSTTGTICNLAQPFCSEASVRGTRARQLCSRTCGCRSAASSNPLAYAAAGCPDTCTLALQFANNELTTNCTDQAKVTLIASAGWKQLATQLRDLLATFALDVYPEPVRTLVQSIPSQMEFSGCEVVGTAQKLRGYGFPLDVCAISGPSSVFKSIRSWCPGSCACTKSTPFCPADCPVQLR